MPLRVSVPRLQPGAVVLRAASPLHSPAPDAALRTPASAASGVNGGGGSFGAAARSERYSSSGHSGHSGCNERPLVRSSGRPPIVPKLSMAALDAAALSFTPRKQPVPLSHAAIHGAHPAASSPSGSADGSSPSLPRSGSKAQALARSVDSAGWSALRSGLPTTAFDTWTAPSEDAAPGDEDASNPGAAEGGGRRRQVHGALRKALGVVLWLGATSGLMVGALAVASEPQAKGKAPAGAKASAGQLTARQEASKR